MTINHEKTKCLKIIMYMQPLLPVPLLDNVNSLKFLGIFFNEKLTWSHHFDYIISKMSRRFYVLRILRNLLSHDQLVEVFMQSLLVLWTMPLLFPKFWCRFKPPPYSYVNVLFSLFMVIRKTVNTVIFLLFLREEKC